MLTINQISKLYQEGVSIKFKNKSHRLGRKGEFDYTTLEIFIYRPAITSHRDKEITILHELVHARNETQSVRKFNNYERDVEKEAIETYNKRPYILQFASELLI